MIFLFSKSNKLGSRLIKWGLDEPVSHFAMVFDERPGGYGILFHSHFQGVGIQWFNDWQKDNEIVYAYAVKPAPTVLQEEQVYQVFVRNFYGKPYDFQSMAYWAWRLFLYKYYGKQVPVENAWGSPTKYLCYEIAEGFNYVQFLGLPAFNPGCMISPYKLKLMFDESPNLIDVSDMYRG